MPLLDVQTLEIAFRLEQTELVAVNKISFSMDSGQTLAIVGESGSGKSVTALALSRLLPSPPALYRSGKILLDGNDVLRMNSKELHQIRGRKIAYVFQEPSTSMNPVFRVRYQIAEAIKLHRPDVADPIEEIRRLLELVGIQDPVRVMNSYPHQLSGGMQQRVMIAMAVACKPALLVADEPTTALDVTIQAQILDLLQDLQNKLNMAVILITHNFAIVSEIAHRVLVMFRGKIVEQGETIQVLKHPQHPYTQALLHCIPKLGSQQRRLATIDYQEIETATTRL